MPSLIYTKNTSGAIRRLRNKKPTKGYLSALIDHINLYKNEIASEHFDWAKMPFD